MSGNSHHYGRTINAPAPPTAAASAQYGRGMITAAGGVVVDGGGGGEGGGPRIAGDNSLNLESTNTSASTTPLSGGPGSSSNSISNATNRNNGNNSSSSKRRKTIPGSRGVANLTPEQLAKKRANDREAQRAIRERQRLKIEQYEREIRELKSQQPYQELQAAVRQKEAVEAELAEVKTCLAAIMAMVQPVLARPPGSTGHPSFSVPQHQALPMVGPASSLYRDSTPGGTASPASIGTQGGWHSNTSPIVPSGVDGHQQQQQSPQINLLNQRQNHNLGHGLDIGSDRLGLDFVLDPTQKTAQLQPQNHNDLDGVTSQNQLQYRQAASQMMPLSAPPSQLPPPSTVYTHPTTIHHPQPFPNNGYPHPGAIGINFTTLHRNCPPTCPLDYLLLNTISTRRQLLLQGASSEEILGPPYPSVASLLNPQTYSHPLSKVFTDILARFPLLSTLPERVAVLYLMFTLMRWQISPTLENWERLPLWHRPSRLTREKEHPAWIDHIPFPEMREKVIREYEPGQFPFDNFFIPFTSTLCLNWPYEEGDVLLRTTRPKQGREEGDGDEEEEEDEDEDENEEGEEEEEEEEFMINPVFVRHLSRLESWTLGEEFEKAFPGLVGTYTLRRGNWKPPPPPPPPPLQTSGGQQRK